MSTLDRARARGYVRAARLAELAGDALTTIAIGGRRLCLVRRGDDVMALDDGCPHAGFSLGEGDLLPDGSVQCALHGARFDPATGARLSGPACDAVTTHDVLIHDGDVLVRLGPDGASGD